MKTALAFLAPFLLPFFTCLGQNFTADTLQASRLLDQADSLSVWTTQFARVDSLCDVAINLLERNTPVNEWLLSRMNFRKGANLVAQRNGKEALRHFEAAMQLRLRLFLDSHPSVGECWVGMANAFYLLSNFDKSREAAETARQLLVQAYGENHLLVVRSYNALANSTYGDLPLALSYLEKSLGILKNLGQVNSPDGARVFLLMGNQNLAAGNNEAAVEHLHKALEICAAIGWERHFVTGGCHLIQSYANSNMGYLRDAFQNLEQARSIFLENYGEMNPYTATAWLKTGETLYQSGDYLNCLPYLHKTLDIMDKLNNQNPEIRQNTYAAIGAAYFMNDDWDNAIYWTQKARATYRTYASDNAFEQVFEGNLGDAFFRKGEFEKAHHLYKTLFDFFWQNPNLPRPFLPLHLIDLGIQLNNLQETKAWMNIVISNLRQSDDPEAKTKLAYAHLMQGLTYLAEKQPDSALWYFDLGLAAVPDETIDLGNKAELLGNKGKIFLEKYRQSHSLEDLEKAGAFYGQGMEKLELSNSSLEGEPKSLRSGRFFFLNEGLMETNQAAFERTGDEQFVQEAWLVSERAKAEALREGVANNLALKIAGIPDSLQQKEARLQADISSLRQKVFVRAQSSDSLQIHAWQGQIVDKKQELQSLIDSLETNYPNYHRLKYHTELAGAAEIQTHLLDDATALLEYFLGDSSIFIFTLDKQALRLDRLPKPKDFDATWEKLCNVLSDEDGYKLAQLDLPYFSETSAKLYDWLLAKPLANLDPAVKNLTIVPDGELGYLPFDLLGQPSRTQTGTSADFKTFNYLLRRYNVSYAYSANLLLEQSNRSAEVPRTLELFAGFAPAYENNDTLDLASRRGELVRNGKYDLPGARQEVKEIAELLGGQAFLDEAASEHNFKQHSQQFRILHLAMHALLEDRNPMFSKLLFTQTARDGEEDNDLNAMELYAMRLPAELAVLSACETGIGKVRRGEGILSLSRAFTYAGVPATVMSLWRADDLKTKELMVEFYKNLKRGMRKDEALRQSKLSYLEHCEEGFSSPFYWAGFVAAGEMRAIFR